MVGILALGAWGSAAAQSDVAVRAARRDTIVAGASVSAVFTVWNGGADTVRMGARVEAPADWTVLVGGGALLLPPGAQEMLVVSTAVPMRAAAGTYVVRLSFDGGATDSVLVRVPPRRGLDVTVAERPPYVVSGLPYEAAFLVRNRGNVASVVRVRARSTLGRASLDPQRLALAPEQSRLVMVRVASPSGVSAAVDDVVELSAVHDSAAGEPVLASARVTVVPEPDRDIEEYLRLPAQLNVRAASSDAVSRFEAFGHGLVRDRGSAEVDFLVRGPTGPFSAFGERDEYRLALRTPAWRARLGDDFYAVSPLAGAAQPGFGAALDGRLGVIRAGAHGQEFRRTPGRGTEVGGFVGAERGGLRGAVNVVSRDAGLFPGQVATVTAGVTRAVMSGDVELARSGGASGTGLARSARLSGAAGPYTFDAGHQDADTAFSGVLRGSSHTFVNANAHWFDAVSFAVNGGSHRADLSRVTGVRYEDRLDVATVGATLYNRYTLQLGALERATDIAGLSQDGRQHSIRIRGDRELAFADVGLEGEAGSAEDALQQRRGYTALSLSLRRAMPQGGAGMWVERYSGGSITRGTAGTFTLGGDATLRLASTDVSLVTYATRMSGPAGAWHSQLDARVSHPLRSGDRVSLRARLIGGGTLSAAEQNVAYLEYSMPLRLPVSRLRTPGRVNGRVVDAESGRGVPGALVRLGPQVAITDRDGSVAFGGVPAGEHRLSMSQETSFAQAVFVGDPTVVVDGMRARPTTFRLAIARSARVDVTVRRYVSARTGMGAVADSLVDAGPLANATFVLAGERDTLYRTTRDDGSATFTDIPPGAWTLSVRGDAPAFHRFDPERMELTLAPGESPTLRFRLVPRKREVQLIGEGEELKSEAAGAKKPAAPPATRTRRPENDGQHRR